MCKSDRARFTQALNCPFDACMAHALALPFLISSNAWARASSNLSRRGADHPIRLTACRYVQSGNLTRLERQLENRCAGGDVSCRREFEAGAPFEVIEPEITQDNSRSFH